MQKNKDPSKVPKCTVHRTARSNKGVAVLRSILNGVTCTIRRSSLKCCVGQNSMLLICDMRLCEFYRQIKCVFYSCIFLDCFPCCPTSREACCPRCGRSCNSRRGVSCNCGTHHSSGRSRSRPGVEQNLGRHLYIIATPFNCRIGGVCLMWVPNV